MDNLALLSFWGGLIPFVDNYCKGLGQMRSQTALSGRARGILDELELGSEANTV